MSYKEQAVALIAECTAAQTMPELTPETKAYLLGLRDLFRGYLQASRDFDVALATLVKEPIQAKRATLAVALKASIPGLLGEDCSTTSLGG